MAITLQSLKLPLTEEESSLRPRAARALGIRENEILGLRLCRMSLDARKKNDIFFSCAVILDLPPALEDKLLKKGLAGVEKAATQEPIVWQRGESALDAPVAVVGLGPAGLFAAYALARQGYRPIVVERGKPIAERASLVARFFDGGPLDPNCNVMFGEGGAGAFSDGKLTTRIKDPWAHEVLRLLVEHGAPADIRIQAKPHIGTDKLVKVVQAMREDIVAHGGEVRFDTSLAGLEQREGALTALRLQGPHGEERLAVSACILAMGQGARDTYEMLYSTGLELQAKPFAVGVRAEHPRELIDRSQYGAFAGHPRLGAAEYHLAGKDGGRGVYTFCMCPGGVVIASSSDAGQVVTNGMSYHARDGANSNAAIVAQVDSRDFGSDHPLAGMRFQADLERAAYELGGGGFAAPAQRMCDFLAGSALSGFGAVSPSYRPVVANKAIAACLPEAVTAALRAGIRQFASRLKGFDMGDAVLTAVESRTSAPVRILRDAGGQATRLKGLYPAGEGAGYAGGIVSAAVDGLRAAERIMALYCPPN